MSDLERHRRLRAVSGAMELALGPEWIYICVIGKADSPESMNIIGNCPRESAEKFVERAAQIITTRRASGEGFKEI